MFYYLASNLSKSNCHESYPTEKQSNTQEGQYMVRPEIFGSRMGVTLAPTCPFEIDYWRDKSSNCMNCLKEVQIARLQAPPNVRTPRRGGGSARRYRAYHLMLS
eukprot:scaffold80416_cov49-Tisochrysis_lutea.AAC.4